MNGIRLGSIFGFEIRIDYSWFVIAFLILWSFSAGVFPERYPGQSPATYLAMGTVGAALFFASLLAHELSHSVVARARGVDVESITLFVFGGMAKTSREAETPRDELAIAGVGPLSSLAIAVLFGFVWQVGDRLGLPVAVTGVARYLAMLNVLLAGFNLLPGFPLDGGRLFRAVVWRVTGDMTRATRWASAGGKTLGYALIAMGALQALGGVVVGGLWLVFIGWFLRTAADLSYRQHVLRDVLLEARASDVMTRDPSTVGPRVSVDDWVEGRLLREPYQAFPVVVDGSISGLVAVDHLRRIPRSAWSTTAVGEIMDDRTDVVVREDTSLADVLERMRSGGATRVMVTRADGTLTGIISSSDVARWVQKQQTIAELSPDAGVRPARRESLR